MTDTAAAPPTAESGGPAPARGGGGLSTKLLPELKQIAGGLGIRGVSAMKKAQLVEAIRAAQQTSGQQTSGQQTPGQPVSGQPVSGEEQRSDDRSRTRGRSRSSTPPREEGAPAPAAAPAGPSVNGSAAQRTDAPAGSTESPAQGQAQPQGIEAQGTGDQSSSDGGSQDQRSRGQSRGQRRDAREQQSRQDQSRQDQSRQDQSRQDRARQEQAREERAHEQEARADQERDDRARQAQGRGDRDQQGRDQQGREDQGRDDRGRDDRGRDDQGRDDRGRDDQGRDDKGQDDAQSRQDRDDEDGSNRRRRRRGRDRERPAPQQQQSSYRERRQQDDVDLAEDDVLVPVAGIVDILENYAFVRTSGYLPGPDDVYVSLSMVRKYALRKGDAVTGAVRQPREGERKEKFNPLVRLETVNGGDVEAARHRVDFNKLTPLYPHERLRLETEPTNLIGRVIDIAAPIGKGQRGLVVSPAKAGKTMVLQSIANSITTNNPECHLMVVLVDERPEEVTDFQRSVKGEVISSTFDRPAADHTIVAELAIERAKRLVELGHDVVVLLDGITRLGRAYNLAAPASGRILSGGVDSAALYPPKKFFGAARNIEDGGSLTILATALIESGSKMDEVIFEEFKGTGNMEIRLRRDFADKRLFPAIDAVQSGTRREELLMSKEELAIVWKLRRVLSGLEGQQALELLLERLKKSHSNVEFLLQVQKTTPEPSTRSERGQRD